jgi:hypothetical protein
MHWLEFKDLLSEWTGLSEDALHIYAAVLLQLGAAAIFRSSVAELAPWLCVLAALAANEAIDIYLPGHAIETWQIEGGIRDLWNTMLLPTALLFLARYSPLFTHCRVATAAPPDRGKLGSHEPASKL